MRPDPPTLRPAVLLLPLLLVAPATALAQAAAAGRADPSPPVPVPLAKLEGPSGVAVAFSRDGRRLLTAGKGEARVWDAQTFKRVGEPIRHREDADFVAVALSADGTRALTASGSEVRLWDAETGKQLSVLDHGSRLRRADFIPGGGKVLTVGNDRVARVWDADTGKLLVARKHRADIHTADLSADGLRVLTVALLRPREKPDLAMDPQAPEWQGAYGVAYLWDTATGRDVIRPHQVSVFPYEGDEPWLRPAALSRDGTRLATYDPPSGVEVWDARTGEYKTCLPMDPPPWVWIEGREDRIGERVATVPLKPEEPPGTGSVGRLRFSPDGRSLLTSGPYSSLLLWDVATRKPAAMLLGPGYSAEVEALSGDGRRVFLAFREWAWVADVATGKAILTLPRAGARELPA